MTLGKISPKDITKTNIVKLAVALFLCYMGCYAGKTILSASSPYLQSEGIFNADQIGTMGFALFVAYGIGQLVNGTIGDYISPKMLSFIGVVVSGILVFCVPFFPTVFANTVLWAIIGFFCSMMWGPLTRIVAENSEGERARNLMLVLNASLIGGTFFAYLAAAIVAKFFAWQVGFYVAGILMVVCGFAFLTILTYLERKNLIVCSTAKKEEKQQVEKKKLSFAYLVKKAFIPTLIYCMVNGFIRNAVSFWIPLYIKEMFNVSNSFASAVTILLPICNFVGTFAGVKLINTRLFKNDEHNVNAFWFILSALAFSIIVLLNGANLWITMLCLVVASASMSSACNLIYAAYVFRFRDTGRISTLSGGLDCSAYLASGTGTKFVGWLVSVVGWNRTVLVWCLMAVIGVVCSIASSIICRKNDKVSAE